MMAIEFRENPYCPGNIQCLNNKHVASIDGYNGDIGWINHATVSGVDRGEIYCKAEQIPLKNERTAG